MSTSDNSIQLGRFKFRSVSSNVDVFFQDEIKEVDEISSFDAEQLEAEYQRGIAETTAALQPIIDRQVQELQQQEKSFQTKIDDLSRNLQSHLQAMEKEIFDEVCAMSITLAELILQKEVLDRQDVEKIIRQTLQEIHSTSPLTINLSAEDLPHLQKKFTSPGITCMVDSGLKPGEVKIDHQHGYLDLTLKGRMEELKEHFKNIKNATKS